MRIRFSLVALGLVAVGGCGGGGGGGGRRTATAPTTSQTTPVTTLTTGTGPTLVAAAFVGSRTDGFARKGDTVHLTFSKEVVLKGTPNPSLEFVLPVVGNTFGTGASMVSSSVKTGVVITLGDNPNLRVSGTFDVANVGSGDSTGIDVPPTATGNIATATNEKPRQKAVDLGGAQKEAWTVAANMQIPRGGHTATTLLDGRILIVGGFTTQAATAGLFFVGESEVYDPIANTFTKTATLAGNAILGDMFAPTAVANQVLRVLRVDHTATLLPDGRVLIVGGFGSERLNTATPAARIQEDLRRAHIFDPKTNRFAIVPGTGLTPIGVNATGRSRHYATLLSTGEVLIAGGINTAIFTPAGATAPQPVTLPVGEIYNPTTGAFTRLSAAGTDMTVPRMEGVADYDLVTKKITYVGGWARFVPNGATASVQALSGGAEEYDEATKKFTATTSKPAVDLRWQAATKTDGGDLWTIGGGGAAGASRLVEAVNGGTFSGAAAVGSLATARAKARAVTLGGNVVLVAGGTSLSGQANHELASCEIVNAASLKLQTAPAMLNARNSFTLSVVNGKVYAIGGFRGDNGQSTGSFNGQPVGMAEVYSRP